MCAYTRFLGPAAFGFFMGCAPQPPVKSLPDRGSAPPPVEPNFDHYSLAYEPYHMLLARGVRPADMDRGCTLIDRKELDAKIEVKFAGDHYLEPCEVEETAVNLWERFPEVTEIIGHGPVPWRIQNPETLKRIREAIEVLNEDLEVLVSSGLKRDSEEYVRRQMLGLSIFTGVTDRLDQLESILRQYPQEAEEVVKPLQDQGLIRFRTHLLQKGGLGLAQMTEDAPIEASADEALRIKKGWCTEKSKILYAVFREAGLKPFFVSAWMKDLETALSPSKWSRVTLRLKGQRHIYLGVRIQNGSLFVDAALKTLFVEYPHSIHLELIHYLAADLSNRSMDLSQKARHEEGTRLLITAMHLDPTEGMTAANFGSILIKKDPGRLDEAIRLSREATRLEPRYIGAWRNLVLFLAKKREFAEAKEVLEEGFRLHPNNPLLYAAQGDLYLRQGDYFVDAEFFRLAITAFQKTLELDPFAMDVRGALSNVYDKLDRLDEAISVLEDGLKLDPGNSLISALLFDLRKKREAAQNGKSP